MLGLRVWWTRLRSVGECYLILLGVLEDTDLNLGRRSFLRNMDALLMLSALVRL